MTIILPFEVLEEERSRSLVTSVSRGRHECRGEGHFSREGGNLYLDCGAHEKGVCLSKHIELWLHKGAYNYTYTHFSKADLRMKTI